MDFIPGTYTHTYHCLDCSHQSFTTMLRTMTLTLEFPVAMQVSDIQLGEQRDDAYLSQLIPTSL